MSLISRLLDSSKAFLDPHNSFEALSNGNVKELLNNNNPSAVVNWISSVTTQEVEEILQIETTEVAEVKREFAISQHAFKILLVAMVIVLLNLAVRGYVCYRPSEIIRTVKNEGVEAATEQVYDDLTERKVTRNLPLKECSILKVDEGNPMFTFYKRKNHRRKQ